MEGHFKQSLLCQPDHCSPNPATHPDQTAARRTRHPLVTKQRTCHKPISKELFPPGTARQAAAATVTCPISFEYSKRSACTRLLIRSKSILRFFCLLVQQSPPRQPFDREAVQQGNCFYDMVSTNQLLYKYIHLLSKPGLAARAPFPHLPCSLLTTQRRLDTEINARQ